MSKAFAAIGLLLLSAGGAWLALSAAGFLPVPTAPAPVNGPTGKPWPEFYAETQWNSYNETHGVYDIVILDGNRRCIAIPHFHVRGRVMRDDLLAAQINAGNNATWVWEGSLKIGDVQP